MMIMPPTDNRTPVVAQAFADITITLEDGGPDRWASGDLGTNFSDPDGDELSYPVGSSNESVADAVISEPGPIVIVQAQGGGTATITITARDPGGLTATQSFRVTVNDGPDHSNTPAGATAIALSESFQGRIDSPNDVDYFSLRVDSPGTLTIRTTGNGDPDIAVFDGAGNEVPGVSGSWIGSITQEILDRGSDLLVRFSGGNAGGEYTGSATLDQTPQTSPDLSVGSPRVSDSSPAPGASFTLSATVNNDGAGDAATTTLQYYQSTDATITTDDTWVGTEAVAGLAALGSSSKSVDLTAPASPGTYYYGACVDAVTGESSATNNCSSSVQVDVTEPPPPSNRSPEAVGQIASRTLEAGGSETFDVSSRFSDPDNDELAYAAASSDTSVATARASGSAVTVTAVASGEALVTVTASDPGGLTAEQGIAVTVAAGNRPPIATETIPDQTIHVWGELQILPSSRNRFVVRGIHNYFSDPDGDPLQYEASSSDERYATVRTSIIPALDHYQMIVDPVAVGQATITLTATDTEGLSANYVFGVNVSPPIPNRRPVVQWPIGARQVYVGVPDLLRFRDHFRDEDNYGSYFQLNYAVSSADNRIALVRVWDKRDHETGHGYARLVIEGVSAGETTATVVATDRAGLSVEHTFNVIARTRPPRVTRPISDVLVSAGVETYVWDLNSYFTDPDGHDLVYGASSSDTTVVRARVSASHPDGPYVVLSARTVGAADITVTATDVTGLTASQTFTVTVTATLPVD